VQSGDSFWSIAEAVTAARLGHAPTAQEIGPLWLRLIDANRAQLPRPGNPNLIYVGTVLTIPP
jgi:nucleoid-associated protein YgaU